MLNVSVSRRYARALLEAAAESSAADPIADQLDSFVGMLRDSPDLSGLLLNPAFTRAQRISVVEAVSSAGARPHPLFENFLRLLVDKNRLAYLPDIARLYRDMADVRAGRLRGKVKSAVPLPKESLQRLAHGLERITQRTVVLETEVDPALLGGVSAQVGSVVYDGSLKSQLETLRRTLLPR